MRTRELRGALALLGLLAVLAPLPAVDGQAARCPGEARRTRADGWVELRSPAFADPDQELVDYAVLPFTPNVLFATNGQTVERSVDGGCTWEEVYENFSKLGETLTVGRAPVVSIEVAPSRPSRSLGSPVYLLRPEGTQTTVIKSFDLGETWDDTTVGLPAFTMVHRLRVSANGRVAYVLAESGSASGVVESNLYVSRDGGVTWAAVFTAPNHRQFFTDFALDPVDARSIWAWNSEGLYHSTDSGVTFGRAPGVAAPVGVVDVQRYPPYEPSRVLAFHASKAEARRSTDGGRTFRTVSSAGVVRSAANVYSLDAVATASDRAVQLSAPGLLRAPVDVTPKDLELTDLAFGLSGQLELFGREGGTVYRRRFTRTLQAVPVKPPPPPRLPPVNLRGPAAAKIKESTLRPEVRAIPLQPGQSERVRYTLDLAPTPTPLDVMFATDSTGSMTDVIASLREDFQDIIDDLARSGVDVWFGVGDFQDYPAFSAGGYPWRRGREVGPIDDELRQAIESINTGSGVTYDSSLAASYQAATGEGQRAVPGPLDPPGTTGDLIEPGQGAEWRPGAVKVIVMAADVRSRDPQTDPGYPGPSYATVIRKLRQLGVRQVGLSVGPDADDPNGARMTLERIARGTSTLAPEGGTDCDDDNDVDIEPGEPLVCSFNRKEGGDTSIAPAIVGLLDSIEDLQPVTFELAGENRVARAETSLVFDEVNVKRAQQLVVDVTFRCDRETAGKVYDISLRARAGDRPVGRPARATVACGAPLPKPDPVRPFPPPPALAAIATAPLPPPAPPAPVPHVQPNTNPNPNPNPQPQGQAQAQAQAGAAAEEQETPQLAFAQVEIDSEEAELAMVGRESPEEQAAHGLLWVALAMTAGAGVALERRSRARAATASVTRRG